MREMDLWRTWVYVVVRRVSTLSRRVFVRCVVIAILLVLLRSRRLLFLLTVLMGCADMIRFGKRVTVRPVGLTGRLDISRLRRLTTLIRVRMILRVGAIRRVLLYRRRGPVGVRRRVVPSWNTVVWTCVL